MIRRRGQRWQRLSWLGKYSPLTTASSVAAKKLLLGPFSRASASYAAPVSTSAAAAAAAAPAAVAADVVADVVLQCDLALGSMKTLLVFVVVATSPGEQLPLLMLTVLLESR